MAFLIVLPHCTIPQPEVAANLVRILGEDAQGLQILPMPEMGGLGNLNVSVDFRLPEVHPVERESPQKAWKPLKGDRQADFDETVHRLVQEYGPIRSVKLQQLLPDEWKAKPKVLYHSLNRLIEVGAIKGKGIRRARIYSAG